MSFDDVMPRQSKQTICDVRSCVLAALSLVHSIMVVVGSPNQTIQDWGPVSAKKTTNAAMLLFWCAPPSPKYKAEHVSDRRSCAEMVVYFAQPFALVTFQLCTWGEGGAHQQDNIIWSMVVFFALTGPQS